MDLAWVAAGRFDGYADRDLAAWDVAAGSLLVREAGGYVTDMQGVPSTLAAGSIVAGNAHVHRPLLDALAEGIAPG
jgi:myo-inositol-1(or 4)-monophosphatase